MPSPDAMPTPDAPTEELAVFDAPLAEAVVAVLTSSGVPAMLEGPHGGERRVLVPPARRAEALATLASRMDEVQELAAHASGGRDGPGDGWEAVGGLAAVGDAAAGGEATRPLVLERFRSFGWVAVALVPLLVLALANVRLPAGVVVALVVGSVVLLSAYRSGRFGGRA